MVQRERGELIELLLTTNADILIIPEGIEHIRGYAFYYNYAEVIIVPNSCTILDIGCFMRCTNLTFLDIGNGIQSIYRDIIRLCPKLQTVIIRATEPPILASSNYWDEYPRIIYVPDLSVDAYKNATNWSNLSSMIKPLSEYI